MGAALLSMCNNNTDVNMRDGHEDSYNYNGSF
jgi:hypothetical protein